MTTLPRPDYPRHQDRSGPLFDKEATHGLAKENKGEQNDGQCLGGQAGRQSAIALTGFGAKSGSIATIDPTASAARCRNANEKVSLFSECERY